MFLSILLVIVWLVLVPFGLGLFLTSFFDEKYRTPGLVLLNGFFVMTALFQIIYIFALWRDFTFGTLAIVFGIVCFLAMIISVIMGYHIIPELKHPKADFFFILFTFLIIAQIVMRVLQKVYDGDDAFFITMATTTLQSNRIFTIEPYTGWEVGTLDARHAFAGAPVFVAFLSKVTGLHPLIMAHEFYGSFLIVVYYCLVYKTGDVLFSKEEDRKWVSVFAVMASVFTIFGNISSYVPQTFMLMRTWQGKAVLCNLCIPAAFLLLIMIAMTAKEEKVKASYYVAMGIVAFSSTTMSTSGSVFVPAIVIVGTLILSFTRKCGKTVLFGTISQIPAIMMGVLYLIYR